MREGAQVRAILISEINASLAIAELRRHAIDNASGKGIFLFSVINTRPSNGADALLAIHSDAA